MSFLYIWKLLFLGIGLGTYYPTTIYCLTPTSESAKSSDLPSRTKVLEVESPTFQDESPENIPPEEESELIELEEKQHKDIFSSKDIPLPPYFLNNKRK